jgi:hypothetical protein
MHRKLAYADWARNGGQVIALLRKASADVKTRY